MIGVDSGIQSPDEPVNTDKDNEQEQPNWFADLLFFGSQNSAPKPSSKRMVRRYSVIRSKDDIVITQSGISAQMASRLKKRYHAEGFKVDLIEESSLTGQVIHHSPSTDKIPSPTPYVTNAQKVQAQTASNKLASLRASKMSRKNAKLNATKDQHIGRVYDKISGLLVFAGSVDAAIEYILQRVRCGIWHDNEWVLYIPKKYWEMLGGTVNA